jgi:RNA polymerase subunit RPABC4/transcription elongation factor Spt4
LDSLFCSHCEAELAAHWIVCPLCAYPTPKAVSSRSLLTCTECNKAITSDDQLCPHCHVPIVRRYCSGCSRLVPDQARFCPHCDTPATARRSVFKRYKFAVAALVVCGFGAFYFHPAVRSYVETVIKPAQILATVKPAATQKTEAVKSIAPTPETKSEPESTAETTTPATQQESEYAPPSVDWLGAEEAQATPLDLATEGSRIKEGRRLAVVGKKLMEQHRYGEALPCSQL